MLTKRSLLAGLASTVAGVPSLHAQDWPRQSVRILVPTEAGGAPDVVARMLGDKLSRSLGQSVVVENITQGGGVVSNHTVARAEPDGSAIGILTGGFAPQAAIRRSLPYNPIADFTFVSTVCAYPMVLAVRPDSPIGSLPDLLARAKANPGKLTYTVTSLGATHHLFGTWMNNQAGTEMVPIPYRGAGPGFTDLLAGRVDVMLEPTTSALPRVHGGQLRVLAVTSPEPYPLLPGVPTVSETLNGVENMTWLGIAAPPRTPDRITDALNAEIRNALLLPDINKRLADLGTIAMPSTPAEFRRRVEDEIARWKSIIAANNIKQI
jgi:tripartite-type tricarboxylate transporter receptor subunit TctC